MYLSTHNPGTTAMNIYAVGSCVQNFRCMMIDDEFKHWEKGLWKLCMNNIYIFGVI